MPTAAVLLSLAALVVSLASLGIAWRAARLLDAVARRLAGDLAAPPPPVDGMAAGAPAPATAAPAASVVDGAAPPPAAALHAAIAPGDDGGAVLVLRNTTPVPIRDLHVALDGCFAGAAGGAYESTPPPAVLAGGGVWRCPVAGDPDPSGRLHLLLRWAENGEVRRRELELPAPSPGGLSGSPR